MRPNPLYAFHPGERLAQELEARGLTTLAFVELAGGDGMDVLGLDLLLAGSEPGFEHRNGIRLGALAELIDRGLGEPAGTWQAIEDEYLRRIGATQ